MGTRLCLHAPWPVPATGLRSSCPTMSWASGPALACHRVSSPGGTWPLPQEQTASGLVSSGCVLWRGSKAQSSCWVFTGACSMASRGALPGTVLTHILCLLSPVMPSGPGEGQRPQVLPFGLGRPLHASKDPTPSVMGGLRSVICLRSPVTLRWPCSSSGAGAPCPSPPRRGAPNRRGTTLWRPRSYCGCCLAQMARVSVAVLAPCLSESLGRPDFCWHQSLLPGTPLPCARVPPPPLLSTGSAWGR